MLETEISLLVASLAFDVPSALPRDRCMYPFAWTDCLGIQIVGVRISLGTPRVMRG